MADVGDVLLPLGGEADMTSEETLLLMRIDGPVMGLVVGLRLRLSEPFELMPMTLPTRDEPTPTSELPSYRPVPIDEDDGECGPIEDVSLRLDVRR